MIEFWKSIQRLLNAQGEKLTVDGVPGNKTMAALSRYKITLEKIPAAITLPVYPNPHPYHPRFEKLLDFPYTHLHPFDVLRSVAGEKEIPGSKDNPLIAHFHEHSGNLGSHSDHNDFSDEVAHCSSALNWAADMSGCRKTNNALAKSWGDYNNPRRGDFVEVGDIVWIKTPAGNHVTLANKRFNRRTDRTFEGFGSNQGNSIKTSIYAVSAIQAVMVWDPLPGTILAPIGCLGQKPIPATGTQQESTR